MNGITSQMIFSPQNCTLGRLEVTLSSQRRGLAEQILARVEETISSGGSCNSLLVGPRGSGKTHLLHYVRKVLEKRHSTGINLVVLPEEARGMASFLDVLLAIVAGTGMPRQEVLQVMAGLPRTAAVEEARSLYRRATGAKPTFVIVENLDHLFDALGKETLAELRGFLQTHAFTSLLASSVGLFADSRHHDHPFYGYFTVHPLAPLDTEGAQLYLSQLADANGQKELAAELRRRSSRKRVKAIFDLTGGNHRLLAMLSTFLTVAGLDELVEPFVQMVDRELTPYYQQRLDRLSPQQYRIVEAIAEQQGRALAVKEIAQLSFLGDTVVSRLLCDLRDAGLLRRTPLGRESYHELREPLLRVVLELKQGRDRPLPLVVNLLRNWYEAEELRRLMSGELGGVARAYLEAAIPANYPAVSPVPQNPEPTDEKSSIDSLKAERFLAALSTWVEQIVEDGFHLEAADPNEEVLRTFDRLLKEEGGPDCPELLRCAVISMFWAKLTKLGLNEEVLTTSDRVLATLGPHDQPQLKFAASIAKGCSLGRLERFGEALLVFEEVVAWCSETGLTKSFEMAAALNMKAATKAQMGSIEEALSVYDVVVGRFAASTDTMVLQQVAVALAGKGWHLGMMGRTDQAISSYVEVVSRFGASDAPNLLENVAQALINQAELLLEIGRSEEALSVYDQVVSRFGTSDRPALLDAVSSALSNKASFCAAKGEFREALAGFSAALQINPHNWTASSNKVAVLLHLEGLEAALGSAEESLQQTESPKAREELLALLLDSLCGDRNALGQLRARTALNANVWSSATGAWVRMRLPVEVEAVQATEKAARTIQKVFSDIPETVKMLDMLQAAISYAKGDRKALLSLPLELRRLVSPKDNDLESTADSRTL